MKSKRILILAANHAPDAVAVAANAYGGGAVFALTQPDSLFIPYGEWPHKLGRQIFTRETAENMASAARGVMAKVASVFGAKREFPIYIGHPDIPGSKDSDKRAYGWGDESAMTAGNDGLTIPVRWTDAGRELIEQGAFRFYSPAWWLKPGKNGKVPVSIKSVGLTNDPNIPVPALSNEADPPATDETDATDKTTDDAADTNSESTPTPDPMTDILTALGLSEGASNDDILAAIAALKDAAANAAENMTAKEAADASGAAAANDAATAREELAAATAELAAANTALQSANTALQAAIHCAVNHAVEAGRVLPAEAPQKEADLLACNDLAAALQSMATAPAKLKTASATGDLGEARSALVVAANDPAAAARAERTLLVANEFAATNPSLSKGERKRIAWKRAAAKAPALFGKSTDGTA